MKFTIILSLLVIQAVGWLNAASDDVISIKDLNAAGYDDARLLEYGITQQEIDSGSVSIKALNARGINVSVSEETEVTTTTEESEDGTSTGGFITIEELKSAGITVQNLLDLGVSQSEIDSGKISIDELKKYGLDVTITEEVRRGDVNVKQRGVVSYAVLESLGLDYNVLQYLGLSDNDYDQNGDVYVKGLVKIGITRYQGQLRITVDALNKLEYTREDLKDQGITDSDFIGSGSSATILLKILKQKNIILQVPTSSPTISITILKKYGLTIELLKSLGLTDDDFDDQGNVYLDALQRIGITVNSNKVITITIITLRKLGYTITELRNAGIKDDDFSGTGDNQIIDLNILKKHKIKLHHTSKPKTISLTILQPYGISVKVLKLLGITSKDYDSNGNIYINSLKRVGIYVKNGQLTIKITTLIKLGISQKDLKDAGIVTNDYDGTGANTVIRLDILKRRKISLDVLFRTRRVTSYKVLEGYGADANVLAKLGIKKNDYDSNGDVYNNALEKVGIKNYNNEKLYICVQALNKLGFTREVLQNAGVKPDEYEGNGNKLRIRLKFLKLHNIYLNVDFRQVISYRVLESYGLDVNVLKKLGIVDRDYDQNGDVDIDALKRVGIVRINGKLTISLQTLQKLGYTLHLLKYAGIKDTDFTGSGSKRIIRLKLLKRRKIYLNVPIREITPYKELEQYGSDANVLTKLGIKLNDYNENGDVDTNALRRVGILRIKGKLTITVSALNKLGYVKDLLLYKGIKPSDYFKKYNVLRINFETLTRHKVYVNVPIRKITPYKILLKYGIDGIVLKQLGLKLKDFDENGDVDTEALRKVGIYKTKGKLTITVNTLNFLGYTTDKLKYAGIHSSDYIGSGNTLRIRLQNLKRRNILLNVPIRPVISYKNLESYGLDVNQLTTLGIQNKDYDQNGDVDVQALKKAGIEENDGKLTITVQALKTLGYTQDALENAGVDSSDYEGSGSTLRIRLKILKGLKIFLNRTLKDVRNTFIVQKPHRTRKVISVTILKHYGLDYKTLKALGLKNSDYDRNGNIRIKALKRIGIYVKRNVIYISVKALKQLGYTSYDLQYAGIRSNDFVGTGNSARITLNTLKRHRIFLKHVKRTRTVKYTDLEDSGLDYDLLKDLGIDRKSINVKGDIHEKKLAKYGIYYENGEFTITLAALKSLGYNKRTLIKAGITDADVIGTGRYARVYIDDLIHHNIFKRITRRTRKTRKTTTHTTTKNSVSLANLYSLGFTPDVLRILGLRTSQLGNGQNIDIDLLNKYGIDLSGGYGFISVKRLRELGITKKILAEYGITSKQIESGYINIKYLITIINQLYAQGQSTKYYSGPTTTTVTYTTGPETVETVETYETSEEPTQIYSDEQYTTEPEIVETYETSEEPIQTN